MKTVSINQLADVLNTVDPCRTICVIGNVSLLEHLRRTFKTRNIVESEPSTLGIDSRRIVLIQRPGQINKERESAGISEYILVANV